MIVAQFADDERDVEIKSLRSSLKERDERATDRAGLVASLRVEVSQEKAHRVFWSNEADRLKAEILRLRAQIKEHTEWRLGSYRFWAKESRGRRGERDRIATLAADMMRHPIPAVACAGRSIQFVLDGE